jgi:hypothetical protein
MKLSTYTSFLSVVALLLQTGCISTATIPSPESIQQAYELQLKRRDADMRKLDDEKAQGLITHKEHTDKLQAIKDTAYTDALNSVWDRHQMDQLYRRSLGLPTPETPVRLNSLRN